MCLGSWHDFVTSVTVINKGVREVLALNVIDDVEAALVPEDFPLFWTQCTSKTFPWWIFVHVLVHERAIRKASCKQNSLSIWRLQIHPSSYFYIYVIIYYKSMKLLIIYIGLFFTVSFVSFKSFPSRNFLSASWTWVEERVWEMFALHMVPDMVLGVVPERRADAAHVARLLLQDKLLQLWGVWQSW